METRREATLSGGRRQERTDRVDSVLVDRLGIRDLQRIPHILLKTRSHAGMELGVTNWELNRDGLFLHTIRKRENLFGV